MIGVEGLLNCGALLSFAAFEVGVNVPFIRCPLAWAVLLESIDVDLVKVIPATHQVCNLHDSRTIRGTRRQSLWRFH